MKPRISPAAIAGICAVFLSGCNGLGRVTQGRAIEFDRNAGRVTIIADSSGGSSAGPRFDVLPPEVVQVPDNPAEMGPQPEAGKLLQLDAREQTMVVFDAVAGALVTVPFQTVSKQTGVFRDDARVAGRRFPIVDKEKKTVTVYSPGQRMLLTLTVAEQHLSMPEDTWRFGDEVRYYWKEPGKTLRFMNVTKTDIQKAGS